MADKLIETPMELPASVPQNPGDAPNQYVDMGTKKAEDMVTSPMENNVPRK